jgi:hypothetical protein
MGWFNKYHNGGMDLKDDYTRHRERRMARVHTILQQIRLLHNKKPARYKNTWQVSFNLLQSACQLFGLQVGEPKLSSAQHGMGTVLGFELVHYVRYVHTGCADTNAQLI